MSDSLIEQVKALVEWDRVENIRLFVGGKDVDFPALLAHMQAQQAVVDAARRATEAFQRK